MLAMAPTLVTAANHNPIGRQIPQAKRQRKLPPTRQRRRRCRAAARQQCRREGAARRLAAAPRLNSCSQNPGAMARATPRAPCQSKLPPCAHQSKRSARPIRLGPVGALRGEAKRSAGGGGRTADPREERGTPEHPAKPSRPRSAAQWPCRQQPTRQRPMASPESGAGHCSRFVACAKRGDAASPRRQRLEPQGRSTT